MITMPDLNDTKVTIKILLVVLKTRSLKIKTIKSRRYMIR